MDFYSSFCNICCKIDDGSLRDISDENIKHLYDTLITFVGHADIIKHNVIYLCHLCCEELTRFDKFREMCFSNLIQFRQRYFNMKSKLELTEDASAVKNALENFVHAKVMRRSSFEESNSSASFSAECHEIMKSSADLDKDDLVFNRQVINLQCERNEFQIVGDCSDVSVMNSVAQCDAFGVAFTNENDVRNKMVTRSEDTKKFESNSHDDLYGSDINNTTEKNTSRIVFVKEEFDLKNEIDITDSDHFTVKNFENESDQHCDLHVKMPVLKNSEGSVNSGIESTKEELHTRQEQSAQGLELQTTEDEFDNGDNIAFEFANVSSIVKMENCGQENITSEAAKVEKKFRSRDFNNTSSAAIINLPSSGTHEGEYGNGRSPTALQSDVHERVYPDAKPHTCALCNQSFRTNSVLIRHDCRYINTRPHKCTVCNKPFSKPSDLARHERIHIGDKPYKCPVCNRAFRESSGLAKHERIHSDDIPYKCSVCNKAFRHLGNLIRHERIHSGDRPYKCNVCDKAFAQTCSLVVHERTHTGEKPYKCSDCNKAFAKSWNLEAHKRTHSGARPYKCNICNKMFRASSSLNKHKRIHSEDIPYKSSI